MSNARIASIISELPKQKHKGSGLTTIDVLVPQTGLTLEYQTIIDLMLIKNIILRRNILHFRQDKSPPLAGPELIKKIRFGVNTKVVDMIIDGTPDPPLTKDTISWALFDILRTSKEKLKIRITKEKMMNKYKI